MGSILSTMALNSLVIPRLSITESIKHIWVSGAGGAGGTGGGGGGGGAAAAADDDDDDDDDDDQQWSVVVVVVVMMAMMMLVVIVVVVLVAVVAVVVVVMVVVVMMMMMMMMMMAIMMMITFIFYKPASKLEWVGDGVVLVEDTDCEQRHFKRQTYNFQDQRSNIYCEMFSPACIRLAGGQVGVNEDM